MMKKVLALVLCAFVFVGIYPCINAEALNSNDLSAASAVLIEARTGRIIFEKNAYQRRPMASTTKIMSAMLCLESGNLDEYFTVDSEAIKVEGSSMGLAEGDRVTKRILCYGMLLPSGNDAANATAVKVGGSVERFVEMMNERARAIGLEDTSFVTPSGLDDGTDEHYSTAFDMAMLTREAIKNPDFLEICKTRTVCLSFETEPVKRWLTNSNKLLGNYEGVKGVKTGFTDKAGRCLISYCERDGVELICVTLKAPNDWHDHVCMYDYGFSVLTNTELECDSRKFIHDIVGGTQNSVVCEVNAVPRATMYKPEKNGVRQCVIMPMFTYAPVICGEKLGEIRYYLDDELITSVDIVATQQVDAVVPDKKVSLFSRLKNVIKGIFN